jgi:C4-dicarboxylate transporter DctM subunit
MSGTVLVLTLGLPLMILMRVPLAFALGLSTIAALWMADIDSMIFAQRMVSGTQSFSLLAIPFFILAGDLMTAGGISRRLVGFADVLVRHCTGGLGMVTVLAAAFFAALSGSAPATTAAIGSIMIPEMEKRGYSRAFATALAVAGGIIGPMLPPSIPMVVWGVMSETSISQLFLAGIVPGLLLAAGLMALSWNHARHNKIPTQPRATRAEVWQAFNAAKWALTGPVIVLGGIYGGIVTPTEAAIVAAVFALVLGFGFYRELTLKTDDHPRHAQLSQDDDDGDVHHRARQRLWLDHRVRAYPDAGDRRAGGVLGQARSLSADDQSFASGDWLRDG